MASEIELNEVGITLKQTVPGWARPWRSGKSCDLHTEASVLEFHSRPVDLCLTSEKKKTDEKTDWVYSLIILEKKLPLKISLS